LSVVDVRRIKVIEHQILPSPFMYSGMGWLPIIPPKTLGIVCCNLSSQKVFKLNGRPICFFVSVKLSRPSLKHYELEVQVLILRPSSAPALTLDLVL
jgi:hypothetical protein